MDQNLKDWTDVIIKVITLGGVYIAAINYRGQRIIKKRRVVATFISKIL